LLPAPQQSQPLDSSFDERGIAVIEYALTAADLAEMDRNFPKLGPRTAGARDSDFTPQARSWLAAHPILTALAERLLHAPVHLTRVQAFDKSAGSNWFVPWHQDRAADGQDRPVAALEQMVALRIHLDDCTEDNGPLDVLPGSHRHGRLNAAAIEDLCATTPSLLCLALRGDIVALKPLLVHRSQRARQPSARRVTHIEYTALHLRHIV
jgi:ectoine hydroxylase-related dioxygenase (phytanoyl-CoA dioxygenase family)